MELLNSIFHFFTDRSRKLPNKLGYIILALILLVIIDNTLSFTYSYNNDNRIQQIVGLNQILKDSTLSKEEKHTLLELRKRIISRTSWKDKTWNLISKIEFKNNNILLDKPPTQNASINRSYFWHFISSSWYFIILMIIMPFIGLADKKSKLSVTIPIILFMEFVFYVFAWIFAKFFSFIPILYGNPNYNYLLNFVLSLVPIIYIIILNKRKSNISHR